MSNGHFWKREPELNSSKTFPLLRKIIHKKSYCTEKTRRSIHLSNITQLFHLPSIQRESYSKLMMDFRWDANKSACANCAACLRWPESMTWPYWVTWNVKSVSSIIVHVLRPRGTNISKISRWVIFTLLILSLSQAAYDLYDFASDNTYQSLRKSMNCNFNSRQKTTAERQ